MRTKVLVLALLVALGATRAAAQSRIEGVVRGVDGTALAGATVQMETAESKKPIVVVADGDGKYVFEGVKAGSRVRLLATHGGRPIAQAYPLVSLWVEQVDLEEQPIPDTPLYASDVLVASGPSGDVNGVVRTADGRPVPGARITVNETELSTSTDSAGRYSFQRLRPGAKLELNVVAEGLADTSSDVVVESKSVVVADFAMKPAARVQEGDDPPVALAVVQPAADSGNVAISRDHLVAPKLDPQDVFRGVQFLPGVVATMEDAGELNLRGGSADQARVVYDGIPLYQLPNQFGRFSPFNGDVVQRVDLARSAFGAADGGRLAGAMRLTGTSNGAGRLGGYANVSMLGMSAGINIPVGDRGGILVGGRISPMESLYEDVLDLYAPQSGVVARERTARWSGGTFSLEPASFFRDINVRFGASLSPKDYLVAAFYDGKDQSNNTRELPSPWSNDTVIPVENFSLPTDTFVQASDVRDWTARGWSGIWRRQWTPAASTSVTYGHSEYFTNLENAWLLTADSTGKDYSFEAGRGGSGAIVESNRVKENTVRVDANLSLPAGHALTAGGEFSNLDTEYGLQGEVTRRTVTGAPIGSTLAPFYGNVSSGTLFTVFAQDAWRPIPALVITPGMRLTNYDASSETFFEPRVSASFAPNRDFRLVAGWAIDHQVINRITREDLSHGDGVFWTLSDGTTVPVARSSQFSAGMRLERSGLLFAVDGTYKSMEDLSLFAPRLFPGVAPDAGTTFFQVGTGTSRTIEILLQKQTPVNTFWTSYTTGRTEYLFPGLQSEAFPASFDQEHELKVADTGRFRRNWTISGVWVIGSGRPYTPASGVSPVWFPTGASVNQLTFLGKNSSRLPVYMRLDAAAQRDFTMGRALSSLGVAVYNILDRDNVYYIDYQTVADTYGSNDVLYMGRALNVFFRIGF